MDDLVLYTTVCYRSQATLFKFCGLDIYTPTFTLVPHGPVAVFIALTCCCPTLLPFLPLPVAATAFAVGSTFTRYRIYNTCLPCCCTGSARIPPNAPSSTTAGNGLALPGSCVSLVTFPTFHMTAFCCAAEQVRHRCVHTPVLPLRERYPITARFTPCPTGAVTVRTVLPACCASAVYCQFTFTCLFLPPFVGALPIAVITPGRFVGSCAYATRCRWRKFGYLAFLPTLPHTLRSAAVSAVTVCAFLYNS